MNVGEGSVNVQEVQVIENKDSRERCERFPLGRGVLEILLIGGRGGRDLHDVHEVHGATQGTPPPYLHFAKSRRR